MDDAEAVFAEGELDGAPTVARGPFWRSFGRADARLYWITFGATVTGTIASVITIGVAGIVLRWIDSSTAPPPTACIGCASAAPSAVPTWAWFTAAVLVAEGFLIVVARRRHANGRSPAAPAATAATVAIIGILVLLGHLLFG